MVHMDDFPYHFCPKCGAILDLSGPYPKCTSCKFIFFQNSKPCVGIFLIKNDLVLLTKRGIEPYKGKYDIPGGFLENGELPETGIRREITEELGVEIKIFDLLGFYINEYGSKHIKTLDIFFVGKITTGTPIVHDDVAKIEWHPISNLPTSPMQSVTKAFVDLRKWSAKNRN